MFEAAAGTLPLDQIQACVERIARKIGVPPDELPTYGHSEDGARPHIESDRSYHFVVVERGREQERRTTQDLDQLLYWIFRDATFTIASRFELKNRVSGADFRRLLFRRQRELLAELDRLWAKRLDGELADILREHPYSDE
ncbi:hypothetical protein GCM10011611_03090 [Aliidongia dinghuensis]|uniref:Immunity protein 63 domain-containing protein n=1 Tax=Aliidongia dinghuensis TaxID=1867774 RepID=A0A8J2YPL4_9PROT|nr:Imm63 family immunity protein [Aliidongia dinghuensis]GGF00885.1 hypothetical protein GCM10011611_03090 [Aliidongia dinghuensis]